MGEWVMWLEMNKVKEILGRGRKLSLKDIQVTGGFSLMMVLSLCCDEQTIFNDIRK